MVLVTLPVRPDSRQKIRITLSVELCQKCLVLQHCLFWHHWIHLHIQKTNIWLNLHCFPRTRVETLFLHIYSIIHMQIWCKYYWSTQISVALHHKTNATAEYIHFLLQQQACEVPPSVFGNINLGFTLLNEHLKITGAAHHSFKEDETAESLPTGH